MSTELCEVTTDTELVRLAQTGDKGAFGTLVQEHHGYAVQFLRSHGCSPEDAEDIVQNAFLLAWRHIDQWVGDRASFRTWFTTILRHACTGFFRHEHNRSHEHTISEAIQQESVVIDSGRKLLIELLAETDEVREIHEAISTLDDDHRPVIELHFFEELHLDVIAERMGIPLGTVKSRMSRAKILLRDRIHEEHLVSQF